MTNERLAEIEDLANHEQNEFPNELYGDCMELITEVRRLRGLHCQDPIAQQIVERNANR